MLRALNMCVIGALAIGLGPVACADPSPCAGVEPFEMRTISVGTCPLNAEVAQSPRQIACGLMHRESLAEDAGMLFLLDPKRKTSFWMKNTLIPLDIVYLDAVGRVLQVNRGVPQDRTWIAAPDGTAFALETNPGKLAQCGLGPGATIDLSG
ncbi:MAG: DUF192 domain-containing protein [Pseudomonadota bacterium]